MVSSIYREFKRDTLTVNQCSDSTGRILTERGKGIMVLYSDDFKNVTGTGPVKDGLKDGVWKGILSDTLRYEATYKNGNLITGISYGKSGNRYTFTREFTDPEFAGGLNDFFGFLSKSIIYPREARNLNIQGHALVIFTLDRQGVLHDIHPVQGNRILAAEALRVMRLSPPWKPATSYGVAVNIIYSASIGFSMAN